MPALRGQRSCLTQELRELKASLVFMVSFRLDLFSELR